MINEALKQWRRNSRRNLWQHPIWGDFQKKIGHKCWQLKVNYASALVIKHDLPKGLSWLEVPRGPLFRGKKGINEILEKIAEIGKREKSIFIRLSNYEELAIENWSLKSVKSDHHPITSLVIDLNQSEEELLRQMKPKGRYNIKVAQKNGVTVRQSQDIKSFYSILRKTAHRDGFEVHPKSYYEKMLDSLDNYVQLLVAEYKGKVIAGGIFVYLDEWGIYYYGASDNEYRNVMAPYLIQWEAIKEAKKRGCKHYDFLGISPENAKNHAWAGVTQFKKKFGGRVVKYPQAKEIILRPFWYWIYRIYKKIRS